MAKTVEYLVADTTAFIQNQSLQDLAANVYTVQEVVDEIRNKRQLRSLVVLPYDLKIKNVFPENVLYITEFSKKTGDYISLSATDVKVMALAYQLEQEKVGSEHLPKSPEVNRIVDFSTHNSEGGSSSKEIAGFYVPSRKNPSWLSQELANEGSDFTKKSAIESNGQDGINNEKFRVLVENSTDESALDVNTAYEYVNNPLSNTSDDTDNESCNGDSDNEVGWITVENIAQVKKEMYSGIGEEQDIVVACITSDFAMQNVLKQMGLHVLTVDGRQIHHLRTYILRCYACFKTTSIMTKIFCPNCGNKTLKKVAVSLKEDGTQHIHINSKRPLTARGKKYSLPTPKGGKHGRNPYLCEDQRFPHQRPTRLAREKNNPLDPDYIAGYSPFIMRDINSRSAVLGIHESAAKYWMKKNPNECKRRSKK